MLTTSGMELNYRQVHPHNLLLDTKCDHDFQVKRSSFNGKNNHDILQIGVEGCQICYFNMYTNIISYFGQNVTMIFKVNGQEHGGNCLLE